MRRFFVYSVFSILSWTVVGQTIDWQGARDIIASDPKLAWQVADSLISKAPIADTSFVVAEATGFGRAYGNNQDRSEAISWFKKIDSVFSPASSVSGEVLGNFTMNFGRMYAISGDYKEAIEWYKKSLQVVEQNQLAEPSPFYLARSLGYLYFNLNYYHKGIDYHKISLEHTIATNGKEHVDVADAYNNIGLIYPHINEPELAMLYYEQASDILENIAPDNVHLASIYSNSGLVRMDQGRYDEALPLIQKANDFHRKRNKLTSQWVANENNLGLLLTKMDRTEEAIDQLKHALQLKQSYYDEDHPQLATINSNLGKAYLQIGHVDSAEYYYQEAMRIDSLRFGNTGDHMARDHLNMLSIAKARSDLSLAENHGHLALNCLLGERINKIPAVDEVSTHYNVHMQICHELGKLQLDQFLETQNITYQEEGYSWLLLATRIMAKQQIEFVDLESKIFLSEKSSSIISTFLSTALDLYARVGDERYVNDAIQVIENEKSYLLLSNIQKARNANWVNLPDAILDEKDQVDLKLKTLRKELFDARLQADSTAITQKKSEIFENTQLKESISNEIFSLNPAYIAFSQPNDIAISGIRSSLVPDKGQMISFWDGKDQIFGIGIGKERLKTVVIEKAELSRLKSQLNKAIRDSDLQSFTKSSFALYQLILSPLLDENTGELTILPSIEMSSIPFEVLVTSDSDSKSFKELPYLLETLAVSYHYSVGIMNFNKQKEVNHQKQFVGFAPGYDQTSNTLMATRSAPDSLMLKSLYALPYAKNEVMSIANMLDGKGLIQDEASEAAFKSTTNSEVGILHIASHVLVNEEDPMLSRIVLSQTANNVDNDGLVHIYELLSMDLQAHLVTISACNTGIGKSYAGEGVMSIARGFMYAGVPNVVMSLWAVPDQSTSEIMTSFYAHYNAGASRADALRMAKLDYLQNADSNTAAPFFWAGFVYLGHEESTPSHSFWLILGVMIALVSGSSFYALRKKEKKNAD